MRAVGLADVGRAVDAVTVVPRGLRSFRGRDSAFFLNLLPGPHDRDGLPEIIQSWKSWILERSTDDEHRVGVIDGPSGCGKSSIVQAGVIPLLGDSVDVEFIQATDRFDQNLHRALRKHAPPVSTPDVSLDDFSESDLVALFAEMLKGRPWLPKTLNEIGGVEGIGTQFLEDAFAAEHAPTKQRMHEPAARRVLESLLPQPGTEVRTRFRSSDEMKEISGYADNPVAFRELLQILNNDLKLISPADRFEGTSGSMHGSHDSFEGVGGTEDSTFQLSHDFLIPSW